MPFMHKYADKHNEIEKKTGLSHSNVWHWLQKQNMQVKEKFQLSSHSKKTDFLWVSVVDYYRDACG